MAVYTKLTHADITEFLAQYDLGDVLESEGIAEGVENTNYLVKTSQGKLILTLFEQRTKLEDLPYFTSLMQHLYSQGIPCPLPMAKRDGRVLSAFKEKPALVVSFLEGSGVGNIKQEHCLALGALMAKMHLAGADFPHRRANALSLEGWEMIAHKIKDRADDISPGLSAMIREELNALYEHWPNGLPSGPIHADVFPDNVFFSRERGSAKLSGVIDFYFACHDMWAYDVAIAVNAWCFDARHKLVPERVQALMQAYTDIRPFTPEEEQAMPLLLRGAALRFLLTRAHDWLHTPADALVTRKDPLEYLAKLQFFRNG
jgi:homoserine kinase type II